VLTTLRCSNFGLVVIHYQMIKQDRKYCDICNERARHCVFPICGTNFPFLTRKWRQRRGRVILFKVDSVFPFQWKNCVISDSAFSWFMYLYPVTCSEAWLWLDLVDLNKLNYSIYYVFSIKISVKIQNFDIKKTRKIRREKTVAHRDNLWKQIIMHIRYTASLRLQHY